MYTANLPPSTANYFPISVLLTVASTHFDSAQWPPLSDHCPLPTAFRQISHIRSKWQRTLLVLIREISVNHPLNVCPSNQVYFIWSFLSWVLFPGSWFLTRNTKHATHDFGLPASDPQKISHFVSKWHPNHWLRTSDSNKKSFTLAPLALRQAQEDSSKWQSNIPLNCVPNYCPLLTGPLKPTSFV